MTSKGHGVIGVRRDLFYDPKDQLDLWPWPKGQAFDLAGDHKISGQHYKAVNALYTFRVCSFIMFIFSYADNSTP